MSRINTEIQIIRPNGTRRTYWVNGFRPDASTPSAILSALKETRIHVLVGSREHNGHWRTIGRNSPTAQRVMAVLARTT